MFKTARAVFFAALLALSTLGVAYGDSLEEHALELVNLHRTANSLPLLKRAVELDRAALRHSTDMANVDFMSHTGSDGSTAGVRIAGAGYRWSLYGENIAVGWTTAEQVMAAWMASPGHRANILNPRFREIGISVVYRPGTRWDYYWTQDFGTRSVVPLPPPPPPPVPPPPTPPVPPTPTPTPMTTYYLSPTGNDSNAGTAAVPWRTLQKAASTLLAGDTVLLTDGEYGGGVHQTRSGTATAPITFRAVNPGKAIVRGDQTSNRDAFFIEKANYVVVDGLTIRQANRAAIRISLSNHVTIKNCRTLDNARWGIFTDYSDDLVLEKNECAGSRLEHGIYVSNSGDRPIIRSNYCHDNRASGIQINADPLLLNSSLGKRGDGITEGALVEGNICSNNGAGGAAGINLASVRSSRIVNNLVHGNLAGGIAGWDDGAGNQWGTKNNIFLHNTVVFRAGQGRWCISLKNGSTGNTVQNNILHGGARGALELDNDSAVVSDYNLIRRAGNTQIATNEDTEVSWTLAQWQMSGNDLHSLNADPKFVSAANTPFDYHLGADSPAINAGVNRTDVPRDLDGVSRPQGARWDMGCYEQRGTVLPPIPPVPTPTPIPEPTPPIPPAKNPSLVSVLPRMGQSGTVLTLTGSSFGALRGASRVTMHKIGTPVYAAVTYFTWSDKKITLTFQTPQRGFHFVRVVRGDGRPSVSVLFYVR